MNKNLYFALALCATLSSSLVFSMDGHVSGYPVAISEASQAKLLRENVSLAKLVCEYGQLNHDYVCVCDKIFFLKRAKTNESNIELEAAQRNKEAIEVLKSHVATELHAKGYVADVTTMLGTGFDGVVITSSQKFVLKLLHGVEVAPEDPKK